MTNLSQHGFRLTFGHGSVRQRIARALRPTVLNLPLDLDELELMEELDPGMVEWNRTH